MRKLKRCSTLFASFMTIAMTLTTAQLPIYANDMEPKVNDEKITDESEPELEKLKIIEGENASHSIGSGEDIIITTNQKFKDFTRMEMKTLRNVTWNVVYDKTNTKTSIRFSAAYLDTLKPGTYEGIIYSKNRAGHANDEEVPFSFQITPQKINFITKDKVAYTKGDTRGLTLISNANRDHFHAVYVDNHSIEKTDFAVGFTKEGGTSIKFTPRFLSTLEEGEHKVGAEFLPEGGIDITIIIKEKPKPAPKPVITTQDNTVYRYGDKAGFTLTCSGELDQFKKLYIDDKEVAPSNYTLKSGSTILTLSLDFMKTLKIGRHKAVFEYPNAKPEIIFRVDKAKSTDSEKNDPTNPTTPSTNGNVSKPQANDKTPTQSNGTQSTIKDTSAKTNNSTTMLLAMMFVMLSGCSIVLKTRKKG